MASATASPAGQIHAGPQRWLVHTVDGACSASQSSNRRLPDRYAAPGRTRLVTSAGTVRHVRVETTNTCTYVVRKPSTVRAPVMSRHGISTPRSTIPVVRNVALGRFSASTAPMITTVPPTTGLTVSASRAPNRIVAIPSTTHRWGPRRSTSSCSGFVTADL
jgi:hypothetical protein